MVRNRSIWKEFTGWATLEGHWLKRKHFTPECLQHIAGRIQAAETKHTGELVVAIETATPSHERDSHQRALEVFGRLRVWDTPWNTGVLLYLSLDRHSIEIIADRGITAPNQAWMDVCERLQVRLQSGEYVDGLLSSIDAIETLLGMYSPPVPEGEENRNDLPNKPVLL